MLLLIINFAAARNVDMYSALALKACYASVLKWLLHGGLGACSV